MSKSCIRTDYFSAYLFVLNKRLFAAKFMYYCVITCTISLIELRKSHREADVRPEEGTRKQKVRPTTTLRDITRLYGQA